MTDLKQLKVSLTKHGAHKVAKLLDSLPVQKVLQSTLNTVPGVNISESQAKKTLSASADGTLPDFWLGAKAAGPNTIKGLVLFGIIFSHRKLIDAVTVASTGLGVGTVRRANLGGDKTFSNFKDDFRELGFATSESSQEFKFDIRELLTDGQFGQLVLELLQAKLIDAGWNQKGDRIDECIQVGFNGALGMSKTQFRNWVSADGVDLDVLPDSTDPDATHPGKFVFRGGHKARKTGEVIRKGHGKDATARLRHNDLQSRLYSHLASIHKARNVRTEHPIGALRVSVDIVVRSKVGLTFYEIKTAKSIRACIREAMSQLLEYAHWPSEARARELVIVSTNRPTKDAKRYLKLLRESYDLPIFHETVDGATGRILKRI